MAITTKKEEPKMKLSEQIAEIENMGIHGIIGVNGIANGIIGWVHVGDDVYDEQFPDAEIEEAGEDCKYIHKKITVGKYTFTSAFQRKRDG